MTNSLLPSRSVERFTFDLQLIAIRRRLGVSPSVARAYADHAFGDGQRNDLAQLVALTADRCATYTGVR